MRPTRRRPRPAAQRRSLGRVGMATAVGAATLPATAATWATAGAWPGLVVAAVLGIGAVGTTFAQALMPQESRDRLHLWRELLHHRERMTATHSARCPDHPDRTSKTLPRT